MIDGEHGFLHRDVFSLVDPLVRSLPLTTLFFLLLMIDMVKVMFLIIVMCFLFLLITCPVAIPLTTQQTNGARRDVC